MIGIIYDIDPRIGSGDGRFETSFLTLLLLHKAAEKSLLAESAHLALNLPVMIVAVNFDRQETWLRIKSLRRWAM